MVQIQIDQSKIRQIPARRRFNRAVGWAALAVAAGSPAAFGITYVMDNSLIQTATQVVGSVATGGSMGGMKVTATFTDGSSKVYEWVAATSTLGLVDDLAATGLLIRQEGATGSLSSAEAWDFLPSGPVSIAPLFEGTLRSLLFDGYDAGIAFDQLSGASGTPGSQGGVPFIWNDRRIPSSFLSLIDASLTVTYSGVVKVGDAAPVGDLYRFMEIRLPGAFPVSPFPGVPIFLYFFADTDHVEYGPKATRPSPTPGPPPVPESGSCAALLSALVVGLGGMSRWQRKGAGNSGPRALRNSPGWVAGG